MNRRTWIIIGIVVLAIIVIYKFTIGPYNEMVRLNQDVKAQWGNVETQYQRRIDLIPNLVSTVQGYANFEKSTLTQVTELRAQVGQAKVNWDNKNLPIDEKIKAANQMESALSRLLVVVEKYPDLKANQNFLELQAEISGTENRVANARRKFNESAQQYNTYVLSFPNNLIAGMFGFKEKAFFEASAGADKAPNVGELMKQK